MLVWYDVRTSDHTADPPAPSICFSPGNPSQPTNVEATAGDKDATITCDADDHELPIDVALVSAYSPCGTNNVTMYHVPVSGQVRALVQEQGQRHTCSCSTLDVCVCAGIAVHDERQWAVQ